MKTERGIRDRLLLVQLYHVLPSHPMFCRKKMHGGCCWQKFFPGAQNKGKDTFCCSNVQYGPLEDISVERILELFTTLILKKSCDKSWISVQL